MTTMEMYYDWFSKETSAALDNLSKEIEDNWDRMIAEAIAAEPKEGDIVRERKYAQPMEVTKVLPPIRQAEVQPLNPKMKPEGPKKWVEFSELVPHKKEG